MALGQQIRAATSRITHPPFFYSEEGAPCKEYKPQRMVKRVCGVRLRLA
jgi:hypothetical protein